MEEFEVRLAQACRENVDIPPHGKGQQTYLAEKMKVSQAAVRKWFAGESRPKQPTMRKLASVLNVDYVWLALGTSHGEIEKRRAAAGRQDSAVYALAGYIIEKGYNMAFASADSDHDIDAIGPGVHRVIVVRPGTVEARNKWTVRFPLATMELANVAAFRRNDALFAYDFIWLTTQELTEHGFREGNDICVDLRFNPKSNRYTLGSKPMIKFLDQY